MALDCALTAVEPGWGQREVLGTPLQCTSYERFIAFCHWRARQPGVVAVDFTNTHIVTLRRHDPAFREITACFDYFVPDAMPLIWVLNRKGGQMRDRVYGPTFMRRCVVASGPPFTHYFLGGSPECLTRLQEFFARAVPGLRVVGARDGYFPPEAEAGIIEEINRLSPDFIWVGLGTPKQQEFIRRHKSALRRGVVFAVGFAFDVNAGTKKDAPAWMQRMGLTWFYRMSTEPRRLVPRYLKYNSLFLGYLLRDLFSGK
jgi:N-acetylglucosaminyldiphosphoundecaprenol N-acetyl-beta-D-mannosaminyltransferase